MKPQDEHSSRPFLAITGFPASFIPVSAITHYAALAWFGCWAHKYSSPLAQWLEDIWLEPLFGGAAALVYTFAVMLSAALPNGTIGDGGIKQHLTCGCIAAILQSAVFIMRCHGISTVSAWNCLWMGPIGALLVTSRVISAVRSRTRNNAFVSPETKGGQNGHA